jgi:gliding motility-associated-like protein
MTVDSFPFVHFNPSYIEVLEGDTRILYPETHDPQLTYLWTPFIYMVNNTVLNPRIRPINDVIYTLTVSTPGGCESSAKDTIKVLKIPLIPNTFTPNNDTKNDTWHIKYLSDYKDCKVQVFNRYGQLVFESHGYTKDWDGTYNGKSLPWGTYYYIIEMDPLRKPITGYVTLIK